MLPNWFSVVFAVGLENVAGGNLVQSRAVSVSPSLFHSLSLSLSSVLSRSVNIFGIYSFVMFRNKKMNHCILCKRFLLIVSFFGTFVSDNCGSREMLVIRLNNHQVAVTGRDNICPLRSEYIHLSDLLLTSDQTFFSNFGISLECSQMKTGCFIELT